VWAVNSSWPWVAITEDVLMECDETGRERDEEKGHYKSTRNWADGSTHGIGEVGIHVYGLVVGAEPDYGGLSKEELRIHGDPGVDFGGVDVKVATFWRDPDLKVPTSDRSKPAEHYALVAYDVERARAAFLGWATKQELEAASVYDYGHGPSYSINWRDLWIV
jgi:hypothetical protein